MKIGAKIMGPAGLKITKVYVTVPLDGRGLTVTMISMNVSALHVKITAHVKTRTEPSVASVLRNGMGVSVTLV
ncbi:hypothetical protein KP79_PYT11593 [Mizuhopecten yessoensis]|uniref:Uncharacterized protein n=1 Tax=Mizuhopecten yessoensis TaxID=6573 RepID=A0A210QAE7_MIZYE|nr:hypothetical protein KP79_PYT11593 [Mizuhopecten yessoensis]